MEGVTYADYAHTVLAGAGRGERDSRPCRYLTERVLCRHNEQATVVFDNDGLGVGIDAALVNALQVQRHHGNAVRGYAFKVGANQRVGHSVCIGSSYAVGSKESRR